MDNQVTKKCQICKQNKEVKAFNKSNRSKDGYSTICTDCKEGRTAVTIEINLYKEYRAKRTQAEKSWRERNKERVDIVSKQYRQKNSEKLCTYVQKWKAENLEKYKEYCRAYRAENREILDKRSKEFLTKAAAEGPYNVWVGMRQRCQNPRSQVYYNYGGRGISVCPEWETYSTFKQWALANGWERGLTIHRVDNDGNYEPSNCIWVTRGQNSAFKKGVPRRPKNNLSNMSKRT